MDLHTQCSNSTLGPMCNEEASGPLALIIIPSLLALSSLLVVALIICSLLRRRPQGPVDSSAVQNPNGQAQALHLGEASAVPSAVREALRLWEIPAGCVVEGLRFCQTGRYGPICTGLLKRDGISTVVVVKTLGDGANQSEAREFVEWIHFHATVCKNDKVARMLHCQTGRLPMSLILEAYSPGNLLHFLWTLRNGNPAPLFSERSVFVIAIQVAAGLDYLMAEHRLVHGDVAARSILLGPGLSVRVSGLGVAFAERWKDLAMKQPPVEVPLKWQAPERILKQPAIDRSDVWSFGILLYELITLGSPPYPELEPQSVLPQLRRCYRMGRPESCGGPLYNLMRYCWMWSFKDRPTFSAITKLLQSYMYLAATEAIGAPEVMDIDEYNRKAGVLPQH